MFSNGPVLLVEDQRLGRDLQSHLESSLGKSFPQYPLDAACNQAGEGAEDLLLVAASTGQGCEQALRLARFFSLQQLPPFPLVVGEAARGESQTISCLDRFVSHRLHWPEDANRMVQTVKGRSRPGRVDWATPRAALEEEVRRRLELQTPSLLPLVTPLSLAASHEVTVLLTGETGTGKTFLARLIHELSPRRDKRLLVVPCGALSANLIESELFGHVKGAFTGADRPKVGKFEAAGDGTLLLDEIDALAPEQQAALLRVLETGEFEPVGSNQTKACKARIITASNWDLEQAVREGRFRRDLYYRLNVLSLHLPPLRQRSEDIRPLARHLAARAAARFAKEMESIRPEVLAALESFPWPGNVRQLENAVQQAVLLCQGPELEMEHLPQPVRDSRPAAGGPARPASDKLADRREQAEQDIVHKALVSNNYNRARAARALGISRVTLYKKMKKYGLSGNPLGGA